MQDVFIGARVRVTRGGTWFNAFGKVVNIVQFNKAKVLLDNDNPDERTVLVDFCDLVAEFKVGDIIEAYDLHDNPLGQGQVVGRDLRNDNMWSARLMWAVRLERNGAIEHYTYGNLRFVKHGFIPVYSDGPVSYKIGDRVRINEKDPPYTGQEGTIEKMARGQVQVMFDDRRNGTWVKFGAFEHAAAPAPATAKKLIDVLKGLSEKSVIEPLEKHWREQQPRSPKVEDIDVAEAEKRMFTEAMRLKALEGGDDYLEYTRHKLHQALGIPKELQEKTPLLGKQNELPTDNRGQAAVFAKMYGASDKTVEKLTHKYGSTVSATIVLASGREVELPGPSGDEWEVTERREFGPQLHATVTQNRLNVGPAPFLVSHDEGLCWLKDMARFVNANERVDHFTERYAYVKELRTHRIKPVQPIEDDNPLPTLRAYLW